MARERAEVPGLWKYKVQADGEGLVLSPTPSSLDVGLQARKLFSNLASLERQEGRESRAQQTPEQPGPGRQTSQER